MRKFLFYLFLVLIHGARCNAAGHAPPDFPSASPSSAEEVGAFQSVYRELHGPSNEALEGLKTLVSLRKTPTVFLIGDIASGKSFLAGLISRFANSLRFSTHTLQLNPYEALYLDLALLAGASTATSQSNVFVTPDVLIIDRLEPHIQIKRTDTGEVITHQQAIELDILSTTRDSIPLSDAEAIGLIKLIKNREKLGKATVITSASIGIGKDLDRLMTAEQVAAFQQILSSTTTLIYSMDQPPASAGLCRLALLKLKNSMLI